ncbi:hypothetical protein [Xenorhabdus littoralis]|uniref:hypothetical protein n=1 Tax=Xenorhabdus littoralis TaxID=2582835 RepID=UPI0029E80DE1|nr:hypothetical protein [Xenorhabdus sp. psl]MDX7991877.1 hypothetical protein [Xenorhabdus sp. psl]
MSPNEERELELKRKYWDKYRETVRSRWNQKAVDRMMEKGSIWKLFFTRRNLHVDMQNNIDRLKHEINLKPLSNDEQKFADVFMGKDFFIVHASKADLRSNDDQRLFIYSRCRLEEKSKEEKKIEFPEYHSSPQDIERLGNDHYVFFSLEVGNTLQKKVSRFGYHFYRIPYKKENIALKHSAMVLLDQLDPKPEQTRMLNTISSLAHKFLSDRYFERYQICFFGIDNCLQGLLYSIILETRRWKEKSGLDKDVDVILSSRTDDEINKVINGFFRPEVRVPRMLGALRGDYQAIIDEGKLRSGF